MRYSNSWSISTKPGSSQVPNISKEFTHEGESFEQLKSPVNDFLVDISQVASCRGNFVGGSACWGLGTLLDSACQVVWLALSQDLLFSPNSYYAKLP